MLNIFFPYKLNPQGFLTEMILSQIRNPTNVGLFDKIYHNLFLDETDNRLFSLNPELRNYLESSALIKTPNKPTVDLEKNKQLRRDYLNFLLELQPYQIASMQPYVRIYLKQRKEGQKSWKSRDIIFGTFDSEFNKQKFVGFKRAGGGGITNIKVSRDYNYHGIDNAFNVDINLYFRDFDSFTKAQNGDYTYLIRNNLSQSKEYLNLEYGWGVNPITSNNIIPEKFKNIFRSEERKTVKLAFNKHDFNVSQTGEVTVSIRYIGHFSLVKRDEEKSNNINLITNTNLISNIFIDKEKSTRALYEEIRKIQKRISDNKEFCKTTNPIEDQVTTDELNKKLENLKKRTSTQLGEIFLRYIHNKGQLFKISFQTSRLRDELYSINTKIEPTNGKFSSSNIEIKQNIYKSDILSQLTNERNLFGVGLDPEKVDEKMKELMDSLFIPDVVQINKDARFGNFSFFPLRALIAAIYEMTENKKEYPFVCLGNTIIRAIGKETWVNIGDTLIEVGLFQKWLFNFISLRQIYNISFGDFMNSIMHDLVPSALYGHTMNLDGNVKFGEIQNDFLELPESWETNKKTLNGKGYDTIRLQRSIYLKESAQVENSLGSFGAADALAIDIKLDEPIDQQKKQLIYYHLFPNISTAVNNPSISTIAAGDLSQRTMNRKKDQDDGFIHLLMGKDRGILKNLTFEHADPILVRNALLAEKNKDSLVPFLLKIYSGTAQLVGTNLFFRPGLFFVIPHGPLGLSPEDDVMGITGYYQIRSVDDIISPGEYTTTIRGMNVMSTAMLKAQKQSKTECDIQREKAQQIRDEKEHKLLEEKQTEIKKRIELPYYVSHELSAYILDFLRIPEISLIYNVDGTSVLSDFSFIGIPGNVA